MPTFHHSFCAPFALLFFLIALPSCVPPGPSLELRMTHLLANNHIMFVHENPPTLGHRRLKALAAYYPDLHTFLKWQGTPNYIAETNKAQNRYIILYYPSSKQQFACRCGTGNSTSIEFSGPYPITPNELKTLEKIQSTNPARPHP